MGNKFRNYDCAVCGKRVRRKRENYEPRVCLDCSMVAMLDYFRGIVPVEVASLGGTPADTDRLASPPPSPTE